MNIVAGDGKKERNFGPEEGPGERVQGEVGEICFTSDCCFTFGKVFGSNRFWDESVIG